MSRIIAIDYGKKRTGIAVSDTLQMIADWEDTSYAVGCITVFCGEVRLIDNIKYKE